MFNIFKPKIQKNHELKSLGQLGEEFAQEEYKKLGFKIIASNFFNKKGLRKGEIDFIATKESLIVFVEVKTRHVLDNKFGSGALAVDIYKQRKLLKAVKIFLLQNPKYTSFRPQIDVCEVKYNELDPVRLKSCLGANKSKGISNGVDNLSFYAKIISNAVEDTF